MAPLPAAAALRGTIGLVRQIVVVCVVDCNSLGMYAHLVLFDVIKKMAPASMTAFGGTTVVGKFSFK